MKRVKMILGKNFGDEGKGLMTAYFAKKYAPSCIVIKHNGGAQAGHTVVNQGRRFVFHQLGSGSFSDVPTFWTAHFMPDLYKISEEVEEFMTVSSKTERPTIYACASLPVVTLYDVLLNQLSEMLRGARKHGSCGMGIRETYLRSENPATRITIGDVANMTAEELANRLGEIQATYIRSRLIELQKEFPVALKEEQKNLVYMLFQTDLRIQMAMQMKENLEIYVTVIGDGKEEIREFLAPFDTVLWETGQGLCLDYDCEEYYPHLTPSKTDTSNLWEFLRTYDYIAENKLMDDLQCEICFVTRTYVTRHGAGALPNEVKKEDIGENITDLTNEPNPWQGTLRYGKHGSIEDFYRFMNRNNDATPVEATWSLSFTHLNETHGKLCTIHGDADVTEYLTDRITAFYESDSDDYEKVIPDVR